MKKCSTCHKIKQLDEFSKNKRNPDGLKYSCKICLRAKYRDYYKRNKEQVSERIRKYNKENKENLSKYSKEWYQENKEKISAHRKKKRHSPALFSSYAKSLTIEEEPAADEDGLMLCRCTKCREYFYPTMAKVVQRCNSLRGNQKGESRLYCSEKCKQECNIFHVSLIPKDQRNPTIAARCNQIKNKRVLLELQIDKFGYNFCDKCGNKFKKTKLFIHHNIMVSENLNEADNMSHQMLVCKDCHTHEGCKQNDE